MSGELVTEVVETVDFAGLAKLREPFPASAVSKLPKGKEDKSKRASCRTCNGYHDLSMFHLDYVGHAALTHRLLDVDPEWTWEPFAEDERGAPLLERNQQGQPIGLWIRLTACGMTRPGYGSVDPGKPDAVKELIGDALRNAGMRFGMALELWHKGDLPTAEQDMDGREPDAVPAQTADPYAAKLIKPGDLRDLNAMLDALPDGKQRAAKVLVWASVAELSELSRMQADTAMDRVAKAYAEHLEMQATAEAAEAGS